MSHHTFEKTKEVVDRYRESRKLAPLADALGKSAHRMTDERWHRFADACSAHDAASELSMVSTFYVADDDGEPMVEYDVEYDETIGKLVRTNERVSVLFASVSMESQRETRHGEVPVPAFVATIDKRFARKNPTRTLRQRDDRLRHRGYRPIVGLDSNGDPDPHADRVDARALKRARKGRSRVSSFEDLPSHERAALHVEHRAHGFRAGSLRYVNDALIHARLDDDELAVAVLVAVLTAGTWKILTPRPAEKCSRNRRGDDAPCNELSKWIASPFRAFAENASWRVIADHVRPYLRDFRNVD